METSTAQAIKLALVGATGLSRDALHIYVGLGTFLVVSIVFRKPLRSLLPLLAAVCVTCLGELVDMRDDINTLGYWRWRASVHDVVNTTFWPLVLFVFARWIQPHDKRG
jgi:hypothetical protein